MNGHLTEQQLIDYEFKLSSGAEVKQAREHLEKCEACRLRLQDLKRKFASLELLRDDPGVSETLLQQTVAHAVTARPAWIFRLYRLPWVGAVAAAVVVGVALLLVSYPGREGDSTRILSEPADTPTGKVERVPATGQFVASGRRAKGGLKRTGETEAVTLMAASAAQPEEISEKPPFAPASAIELVVLPRRENVQLTIYNAADLTLVRERRNLTLKKGWNWLQFMWANTLIDPTSLSLEPLEHRDQVDIEQLVFPPRLRELGRWLIRSEVSGQVPFELTYFTSGLSWRAFYMGTLAQDEKTMHLQGYVRVHNGSGEDYENAQTRLIVGQIHLLDQIAELASRQHPYGSPILLGRDKGGLAGDALEGKHRVFFMAQPFSKELDALKPKEIRKEGLSEYFLYTIEGTETIPNEWGKRLLSFEADDIPVKSLYKYDDQRWGDQTIRFLSFANDQEHGLGETPLPDGAVRIYGRSDEQGHLSYTGGASVKYIPVGEEIELNLGPARLVEIKPVLMDYRTENYAYDNDGDVIGWDEVRAWRIDVANARTLPIEVEITRGFETPYWTLEQADRTATYEKHDVTHARFKLSIEPRTKRAFGYTVTTYHGVREGTLSRMLNPGN
jgi:hypothetical protein